MSEKKTPSKKIRRWLTSDYEDCRISMITAAISSIKLLFNNLINNYYGKKTINEELTFLIFFNPNDIFRSRWTRWYYH